MSMDSRGAIRARIREVGMSDVDKEGQRAVPRFESKLEQASPAHKKMMKADLILVDHILGQYFGPLHTIRFHLKEFIDRL